MRSPLARPSPVAVAIALVTIVCAEGARAQEAPLPAVAGAAGLRARAAAPRAVPRPSLAEIMAKGGITQDLVNRRRADPNEKAIPAANAPALAPRKRVAAPQRRPTVNELVQKIRSLPGGQEQLDRAQRARAAPPAEQRVREENEPAPEAHPGGPFVASSEVERVLSVGPAEATFAAGYEELPASGGTLAIELDSAQSVVSYPSSDPWPWHLYSISDETHRPIVRFRVQVPTTGWYIVDVEATSTPYAKLRTLTEGRWTTIATSWSSYPDSPNLVIGVLGGWPFQSYPVLLNLAAGIHVFEWFLTAPAGTLMQTWFGLVDITQW